jgi:hypothetical protein
MNASHLGRHFFPEWLERWAVMGLIGIVMLLTDRRISSLEDRLRQQELAIHAEVQRATDATSILEAQRNILHDMRVLCGNKNLNVPCPEE